MVGNDPDMTEHPDDILRALADPERLRIAGALAAGDAAAATLAESLDLPIARVRRHLTRLAAAGIAACSRTVAPTVWTPRRSGGPPSRSDRRARRGSRSARRTRARKPCCGRSSATAA